MPDLNVEITAGLDRAGCGVDAWGTLAHTITEDEATAFGFGDREGIRVACGAGIGREPDRWFLRDPTTPRPGPGDRRHDNSHDTFGWQPVTVTLRSTGAEFLGVDAVPVIAHHVRWDNGGDRPARRSAGLSVAKSETVIRSQTLSGAFACTGTIGVSVDIEGERSFCFEAGWSDTAFRSRVARVGADAGGDVPAHSAETACLLTDSVTARFRVTYEASLSGVLLTVNDDWYGGHRHRGLDPRWVLWRAGLPATVTVQHDYAVGFHSGAEVDVAPGPFTPGHRPGRECFRGRGRLGHAA
ncbi:hypothetical protein [Actinokineospora spheciospongiae]|uniref:hypothetical protein n=1 Tax=Actinokineospora spheciospongiae TaxID=909613 RepID=UPI000D70D6D1|nr:hypothetical protein [Actinokineospora spheciospongiae]PWW67033.1 hypothetical protein DFQ13_101551 [Actinokineospora spheciospongiae]